jgi:hypothetical protein
MGAQGRRVEAAVKKIVALLLLAAHCGPAPHVEHAPVAATSAQLPTSPPSTPSRYAFVAPVALERRADAAVFSSDGKKLVVLAGDELSLIDTTTHAVTHARIGKKIASSSKALYVLGRRAFEVETLDEIVLPVPAGFDCAPWFSADGRRASATCFEIHASDGSKDGAWVFDTTTGSVIARVPMRDTSYITDGSDGAPAAFITSSGRFLQWGWHGSGSFQEISSRTYGPPVSARSTISPDESLLFTTVDHTVLSHNKQFFVQENDRTGGAMLDPKNGRKRYEMPYDVFEVSFSPTSRVFAATHWIWVDHDGPPVRIPEPSEVTVQTSSDGAQLARIPGVESAVFAPDDSRLAALGERVVRFYRAE